MSSHPSLLLFDLGGVLLESTAHHNLRRLTGIELDIADYRERWLRSPAVCRFEAGRNTPQSFAEEFLAEWRIPLAHGDFLEEFTGWALGFYPGARELLADLRQRFRTACLSNSNELHWRKFGSFEGIFDIALSSHELGVLKPEDGAFARALEICAVDAAEVMFFDDSLSNVESARRLGLNAFQVEGFAALKDLLTAHGLLPD